MRPSEEAIPTSPPDTLLRSPRVLKHPRRAADGRDGGSTPRLVPAASREFVRVTASLWCEKILAMAEQSITDVLPAELLYCVLRALRSLADLAAVTCAHRSFRVAASDPELWELIANERWRWRMRLREGETYRDFCQRSFVEAREHERILFIGGMGRLGGCLRSHGSFKPRSRVHFEFDGSDFHQDAVAAAAAAATDGHRLYLVGGCDPIGEEAAVPHVADFPRQRFTTPLPVALCCGAADVGMRGELWFTGGGSSMYRGARVEACIRLLEDPLAHSVLFSGGVGEEDEGAPPGSPVRPPPPPGPSAAWRTVAELQRPRCGHALAYDGRTTQLYSVGGYGGGHHMEPFEDVSAGGYHDTVETLDTQSGHVAMLPQRMAAARTGVGAAVGPDGCLYAVGGSTNGERMLASCERYDPRRGAWEALPPMPTARGYLAATFALDGVLYAAGGAAEGAYFRCGCTALEAFDPRKGAWEVLPPLPTARSILSCALVTGW